MKLIHWLVGIFALGLLVGFIYTTTTAAHGQPRPVQLWTLWLVDDDYTPLRPLLRFTSLDGCVGASYRLAFTTGELTQCAPYRLGDFR